MASLTIPKQLAILPRKESPFLEGQNTHSAVIEDQTVRVSQDSRSTVFPGKGLTQGSCIDHTVRNMPNTALPR